MKRERDLISLLPRRLALRFESLGAYVSSIVHEDEDALSRQDRLTRKELRQIQLVIFARVVHSMFREGTRAAIFAVNALKNLDVPGFRVGTSIFEGRNENVMRGENLAKALSESLGDSRAVAHIGSDKSLRQHILDLRREVLRARTVD